MKKKTLYEYTQFASIFLGEFQMHIKFDVIDGVFEFHIVTLDAYGLKQKKFWKLQSR